MFERFTAEARAVVVAANREADSMHHRFTGTEHLLLGLLSTEGPAATFLVDAGLRTDEVRADILRWYAHRQHLGPEDAAALESIGIDLAAVRSAVEESFGAGTLQPPPTIRRGPFRRVPSGRFGPRARKVLELSLREAVRLKDRHIGAEHILLGLVREGQGVAMYVLTQRGVDIDLLRAKAERRRAA